MKEKLMEFMNIKEIEGRKIFLNQPWVVNKALREIEKFE